MNTKELIEEFLKEGQDDGDHVRAKALMPEILSQMMEEYGESPYGPNIPEEIFLMFNTPQCRGLLVGTFFLTAMEMTE